MQILGQSRALNQLQGRSPVVLAIHPDVEAWRLKTFYSGTVTTNTLRLLNDFVRGCDSDGILPIVQSSFVMPFVGGNLVSAATALYPASALTTIVNFAPGDFSEATGLDPGIGNTTKHLRSNVLANSVQSDSSGHILAYNRSGDRAGGFDAGARQSTVLRSHLQIRTGGDVGFFGSWGSTQGSSRLNVSATLMGDYLDVTCGLRLSPTDARVYRRDAVVRSVTSGGGNVPSNAFFLWAENNSNVANELSSRNLAFFSAGPGMSEAQYLLYRARIVQFQQALGRHV